jgi:tetratricopeptide (TPR) repeat protein
MDLVFARRYDEAIAAARATLQLQPNAPVARGGLYYALFMKGMFDEALAIDREDFARDHKLTDALERGYAEAGYRGAQRRLAGVLAGRSREVGGLPAISVALTYLFAGDADNTLEWLERAYRERDGQIPYLGLPIYDSIRSDPRFQDLLRRVGLPH